MLTFHSRLGIKKMLSDYWYTRKRHGEQVLVLCSLRVYAFKSDTESHIGDSNRGQVLIGWVSTLHGACLWTPCVFACNPPDSSLSRASPLAHDQQQQAPSGPRPGPLHPPGQA